MNPIRDQIQQDIRYYNGQLDQVRRDLSMNEDLRAQLNRSVSLLQDIYQKHDQLFSDPRTRELCAGYQVSLDTAKTFGDKLQSFLGGNGNRCDDAFNDMISDQQRQIRVLDQSISNQRNQIASIERSLSDLNTRLAATPY